jgi:hypothetical protein
MFRRIQLLGGSISGLCFREHAQNNDVVDAWSDMNCPKKKFIKKNVRFYFTEKGWELYGRKTVAACMKTKTPYRVLSIEEHEVSIYYKDDVQVCLYPKRLGRK